MDYLEDFRANLKLLPPNLLHTYTRMQDLDKNVEALQRKNEQCCEQEIEDIRKVLSCNFSRFPLDTSYLRFSDQALDEQKDSIDIADRKVALANQAYDLVDSLIQILDRYMRESVELRQERMLAAAAAGKKVNGSVRARRSSKSSRGRTKTQLAADPLSIKLDFPLDPNEPKYCFCNRVSYGRMVCCDNPDCKIEWFHFDCVGLKEQPDGEWHCPDCVKVKKHRRLN